MKAVLALSIAIAIVAGLIWGLASALNLEATSADDYEDEGW